MKLRFIDKASILASLVWILLLAIPHRMLAQMPQPAPHVFIMVNGEKAPMRAQITQTEEKKGWDIQGFNVGRKLVRYFSGKYSKQLSDTKPTFAIYPKEETLNDYALIRLNKRGNYRRLPDADILECGYTRINMDAFVIENLPEMGFLVTPVKDLFPGEYILINLKQTPQNKEGDLKAYDFSVRKE